MVIAEISRQLDLSADTLHYYERVGLLPSVPRTKSGIRNYGETDVKWAEFIKCMRGAGLPAEVLIGYVQLCQQGDHPIAVKKEILKDQRQILLGKSQELQAAVSKLDAKMEHLENTLLSCEQALTNTSQQTAP